MQESTHRHLTLISKLTAGIIALLLSGPAAAGPDCDRKPEHPSCGGDGGGGGGDNTPPADVGPIDADATTNTISLRFVAPGDDGMSGEAAAYDVRISSSVIDESNFLDAERDPWSQLYLPLSAGTAEYWTIRDRTPGTTYYVAVKALDDAGNASSIQTASAPTPPESPPVDVDWSVTSLVTVPDFDGRYCCVSRSLGIDSNGHASVTYLLDGIDTYPNEARYAGRPAGGTWIVEDIGGPAFSNGTLAAEFGHGSIWGMTQGLNPASGPEVVAWGRNYAIDPDGRGRNTGREAIIFAARQASEVWSREVVNDGGFEAGGSGDHDVTSLVYVPSASATPVPTAAFVTWPAYGKKAKTNALTVASRTGPGEWTKESLFECPHEGVNPYIPVIGTEIRLHVDSQDRLHFQTTIADGITTGYKTGSGWQFYWSGVLPGPVRDTELSTDASDNQIVAYSMADDTGEKLYLLEATDLIEITEAEICSPPLIQAPQHEVIDSYDPDVHDAGNMVDANIRVRVDGLLQDSNGLYVGTLRFDGDGPPEHRILARCGATSAWVRDPTDRTRATGQVVFTEDGGLARVYYLGTDGAERFTVWGDQVFFAERDGTPCDLGQ